MLIKLIIFIEDCSTTLPWCTLIRSHGACGLRWGDQVNANAKSRLSGVNFHLGMLLMLLALRFDLVHRLFQKDLKLSLG